MAMMHRLAAHLPLLLLCTRSSALKLPAHRRSTLLSHDGARLGWVDETVTLDKTLTLRVHCSGEEDTPAVRVTLPAAEEGGQLMSSCLWPVALATAVLLRRPRWRDALAGRDCLELGAGLGLTGVVAGHSARSCLLTDHDAFAVDVLRRTAEVHR